jgi:transcriptional regulator with XRE-family HTH domain
MNQATNQRIQRIKDKMEYFGVSPAAVAVVLGISAETLEEYLNGRIEDQDKLWQLEVYLRGEEFYLGYTFRKKERFAELFIRLWDGMKSYRSEQEICEALGIIRAEARHIKERKKSLDVWEQYDILFGFYNLCIDETGAAVSGLEKLAQQLFGLLRLDMDPKITEHFADTLNELLEKAPVPVHDEILAEASQTDIRDIQGLRSRNDYPMDVDGKLRILETLGKLFVERKR